MENKFISRNKIEGYKPHRALQRDFSLIAKPYLTEHGIPFDTTKYQSDGIFRIGDNDFWFDSDKEGFFTDHPDFKDTPYNGIKDLLEAVYGSDDSSNNEESDSTDADSVNIADFEDEIKESGGDVNKIVERIIDLSKTTDMSSDDIEYMRDVLTQKVKDYLENKNNSTDLSGIAKSITANDLGRSL